MVTVVCGIYWQLKGRHGNVELISTVMRGVYREAIGLEERGREGKENWRQEKGKSGRRVRRLSLGTSGPREYDRICVGWKGEDASQWA